MWPLEELQVCALPGFGFVLQHDCPAVVFFTVQARDISVPGELLYMFSLFFVPTFFRVDVVICLSTTVRNDTLQDAKEQRVSVKCRKQLRVEEVEMVCSLTGRQRSHLVSLSKEF